MGNSMGYSIQCGPKASTGQHNKQATNQNRTGNNKTNQNNGLNLNTSLTNQHQHQPSSAQARLTHHNHNKTSHHRHQCQLGTESHTNATSDIGVSNTLTRDGFTSTTSSNTASLPKSRTKYQLGSHTQIPLTKARLPAGYTKRQTSQGQVFFVDLEGRRYWNDPSVPRELLSASLDLDQLVGKLSSTWEIKQAPSGKIYYVNHIKKTTQFTDPRLVAYREYLMSILRAQRPAGYPLAYSMPSSASEAPASPVITNSRSPRSPLVPLSAPTTTLCPVTAQKRSLPSAPPPPPSITPPSANIYSTSPIHLNQSTLSNNINSSKQQQAQTTFITSSPLTTIHIDSKLLTDKISILRQELVKRQVLGHTCKIDIRRRKIFEESFRIVSQMSSRDLKKRLNVRFRGEEGVDFGGVAREWFYLLSREMLNPVHGLFQYTSSDIYNLQINPDSGIVYNEHLSYMHFCGRIIGMAVFHGHFTEGHFTLPFYKMLLRRPIVLADIEFVDPELHRSLCWMLENDITDVLDTTFLVEHNAFGQLQEHELIENGKEIAVTEKNKHQYVSLYVNYRCRRGIERQSEALQRGFDELIDPNLLKSFNEHELELLIGGLSKINVDDWKTNTKLKNCTIETALVKWFWDIVKQHYNEDKRAQLLQFVTGSPRVPIQGFKALRGVEAELRPFTIHLIRNGNTNDLPKSHTCFNRLDLPPYETYDKLRDKLTQAIEETMGFAMQ